MRVPNNDLRGTLNRRHASYDDVHYGEDRVDAPDYDEVDGPGAGAAGGGASRRVIPGRMTLRSLKPGTKFKNWAKVEITFIKASTQPEPAKITALLEVLLDSEELFDAASIKMETDSSVNAVKLLEHLSTVHGDMVIPIRRKPTWPQFQAGDSIRTHAAIFKGEADASNQDDNALKMAFMGSLHGSNRNHALQYHRSHPNCTSAEVVEHVVNLVENNRTQVDFSLLNSMTPNVNERAEEFGARISEAASNVLVPRGYTETQINDMALNIFIRNIGQGINEKLAAVLPPTLPEAIARARNLQEIQRQKEEDDKRIEERVAAFRGPHQNQRGKGGRGRGQSYNRGGRGGGRGGGGNRHNNGGNGGGRQSNDYEENEDSRGNRRYGNGGGGGSGGGPPRQGNGGGSGRNFGNCYRCNQPGHIRKNCPEKPKEEGATTPAE